MRERISYLHVLPKGIEMSGYRKWATKNGWIYYLVSLELYCAHLEFDSEEDFEKYSAAWKTYKSDNQQP